MMLTKQQILDSYLNDFNNLSNHLSSINELSLIKNVYDELVKEAELSDIL